MEQHSSTNQGKVTEEQPLAVILTRNSSRMVAVNVQVTVDISMYDVSLVPTDSSKMMKRTKARMLSSVPPMAVVLQRCVVPKPLTTDESTKTNKVYMERFVFQDTSKHDGVFDGPCGSVSEETSIKIWFQQANVCSVVVRCNSSLPTCD
uniref:Uncharacterized protein n=1 Tax=Ditylenchus dipsaci TaxID=166011 RepID=A0A915DS65_9BILA